MAFLIYLGYQNDKLTEQVNEYKYIQKGIESNKIFVYNNQGFICNQNKELFSQVHWK
jgi:hypothetical protein